MTWLRQPLVVTRRGALLIALAVGLSIGAAIIIATGTVSDLRNERERAIQAETFSKGEIVRLVHRVARLERPSALEIDYRIRVGLRRCLRSKACLRLFGRVSRVVKRGGRFVFLPPAGGGGAGGGGSAGSPPVSGGSPSSPGSPSRPGPGSPSPAPPPPPAPAPPSGPSRPNLAAPIPVQVCTMLVGVNCP